LPGEAATCGLAICDRLQRRTPGSNRRPGGCRLPGCADNHHYRVIQSLEFTTAPGRKFIDTLDGFRKKRNLSSYDVAGSISDKEAEEMLKLATSLRADVEKWIRATRPELFAVK
jgi:hypothetical protein